MKYRPCRPRLCLCHSVCISSFIRHGIRPAAVEFAASRHPSIIFTSPVAEPGLAHPVLTAVVSFFDIVMGALFSSQVFCFWFFCVCSFFSRRLDHNLTIGKNSNLKDFDHRGENFLIAKSEATSLGPRMKSRDLLRLPGSSGTTYSLPH